jgi:hypothetical protein
MDTGTATLIVRPHAPGEPCRDHCTDDAATVTPTVSWPFGRLPSSTRPAPTLLTVRLHPLSHATITVTIRGASAHRSATVIPDRRSTLGIITTLPVTAVSRDRGVERHDAAKKGGAEPEGMGEEV